MSNYFEASNQLSDKNTSPVFEYLLPRRPHPGQRHIEVDSNTGECFHTALAI